MNYYKISFTDASGNASFATIDAQSVLDAACFFALACGCVNVISKIEDATGMFVDIDGSIKP
jgi:hypothetical protein